MTAVISGQWGRHGKGRSVLLGCVLFSAGTIVVFTLLRDGWPTTLRLGAWNDWSDARQDRLRAELTAAFTESDAAEYEQWERVDLLDSHVFDRVSVRINGNAFPDDAYLGRWPATFLWASRCVFVEWTVDGTTVRDGAGRECAVFMS